MKAKQKLWGIITAAVIIGCALTACEDTGSTAEYCKVTWDLNGGKWPAGFTPVTKVVKDTLLTKPGNPVKDEYVFINWFTNDGLTTTHNFTKNITADITLYAKWGRDYSISITGGTADKEKAAEGTTITLKPDTQASKVFVGWKIVPPIDTMLSENRFIMPEFDVTITGIFEDAGTGNVPYHISNNLAQDSSKGFLVQWHNATTVSSQTLQLVKAGRGFEDADEIAATVTAFQKPDTATCSLSGCSCTGLGNYDARNIFRVTVTGLSPATQYKYRVGSTGAWSEPYYYLTSGGPNTDFSFTVVTDTQDDVFEGMTLTLRAANEYDPDHRFFIHAGDVVNYIGLNPSEIENYMNKSTEFIKYRPIAATQGNHDTYHNKSGDTYIFGEATIFNAFITFPPNGFVQDLPTFDPNRGNSYYFYYNKVLIVVLNTLSSQNPISTSEPNLAAFAAQQTWFRNVLQKDKDENLSKYRIVITHVPFFPGRGTSDGSPAGTNETWIMPNSRAAYGKILDDFDVDIYFAGHDHVYGRSHPIKVTGTTNAATTLAAIAIENPGADNGYGTEFGPTEGGTIHSIVGSTGPKTYAFRNQTATTSRFIPRIYAAALLDENGTYADSIAGGTPAGPKFSPGLFVNVKVTDEKLVVNAIRRDGVVLDTYEVEAKR